MQTFLWVGLAFLSGALPFSVWVGQWLLQRDIRTVGDANPGATNVFRAGGKRAGALAVLLDVLKGAAPVSIAYLVLGLAGPALVAVAVAPVLGHAFTPFLGWRGGKAVAVTCGIWCGLTVWEGPTVGGILLGLAVLVLPANGWAVLFAMSGLLLYLVFTPPAWNLLMLRPDTPTIVAIWVGNMAVLLWKHRLDFAQLPHLCWRL